MPDLAREIHELVECSIRPVSLEEVRQRAGQSHRRRARGHRLGIGAAAAVVAVAAVILAFVLVPTGTPGGPPSAAATELQTLASRADNIPRLGPGKYVYSAIERQIGTFGAGLSPKDPGLRVNGYWSAVVKTWINAQGDGRLVVEANPTAHLYTKSDEAKWKAAGSPPLPGPPGGTTREVTITPAGAANPPIPSPTPLFQVSDLPTNRTALRRVFGIAAVQRPCRRRLSMQDRGLSDRHQGRRSSPRPRYRSDTRPEERPLPGARRRTRGPEPRDN